MRRLLAVELTRYRTRRIILLLVAAAAVLAAFVAFQSAWDTRPPSKDEIATAQANAEAEAGKANVTTECLKSPTDYLGPGATAQECEDLVTDTGDSYLPRDELSLRGTLQGNGSGIAALVICLLVIAGSTFAGADWSSGSIRNQVLFEPRRGRVWAAKALAVSIASGAVALVVLGGFWISLYLVAADRGVPHGSAVVGDVVAQLARAVALAAAAGLGAFALTTIFRHSVATLALLFAYSVGGEIVVNMLPIDGVARWSLGNNVFGWLETRLEFFDPTAHCLRIGTCEGPQHLSHLEAGAYLLVLLVVAAATSFAVFRRRDI